MKVAVYVRVSKEDQNPATQKQLLLDYCKNNDYDIFETYQDKLSGAKDSRPEFNRLVEDMRQHKFRGIVVYKLDRIGRSLQHLLQLFQEFQNINIDFISITQPINTTTPEGKMFLRLLMILAEYERELIVARTRDTLDKYKKQIEDDGYFISKDKKKIKKLGRPKGSKDTKKRRKSGYLLRWSDK